MGTSGSIKKKCSLFEVWMQVETNIPLTNIPQKFLRDITKEVILDVQSEYQGKFVSVVTDNAENMNKMRNLVVSDYLEISKYPVFCSQV